MPNLLEAAVELHHRFEVPVGIDRAWESLLDMEQVAACFPGATLTSADGKEYTGSVKVKLGPIQLTYKGSARIVEADEAEHRAVIEASGNAARSGSTASMKVNAVATAVTEDRTEVSMTTDLTITGRPAQFGRGVMAEVGDKILGRFAECLASKLSAPAGGAEAGESGTGDTDTAAAADTPAPETPDTGDTAVPDTPAAEPTADAASAEAPPPPSAPSAEAPPPPSAPSAPTYTRAPEPIDLLESAGTPVLKRVAPVVGGLVVLWLVRRLWTRCRRRQS